MEGPPALVIPTTTNWEIEREGGTEKFIRNLAREAAVRRLPIQILSTGNRSWTGGSIDVVPIMLSARTELAFVRALRRKLRSHHLSLPPRAVVLANAEHYVWPFMGLDVPVVLLAHGAVPPTLRTTRGRFRTFLFETFLEHRAIRRASRILVVSEETGTYYRTKFPEAVGKILVIPIGLDLEALASRDTKTLDDRWSLGPHRPKVLFAGRLSIEKRLQLLIDACNLLRISETDLQLVVAGDGPLRGWLSEQSRSKRWILPLGRVPHNELMNLMVHSDLLAIPSSYEGLPTVLLEAVATGLPVVSTKVGRAMELLGPANGVIAEPSPNGFADGIARALRIDRDLAGKEALRLRSLLDFRRTADAIFDQAAAVAKGEF